MLHPDTSNSSISGELLIRNGIIEEIGKIVHHPKEALEVDLQGMHVYPSFIEPLCDYGMPEAKRYVSNNATLSAKEGAFSWNEALRSETKASQLFNYKEEEANKYREAGYGIVQTHMPDGISRGSATVVSLNRANEHELILIPESAHVLSFNKGSSAQEYPGSLMGSIALLRQSYLDGQLYQTAIKKKEVNFLLKNGIAYKHYPKYL